MIQSLINNQLTIATAESLTGGLIAHYFSSFDGISSIFRGSIVAYQNKIKEQVLNVSKKIIEAYGAVSQECAYEMVKNCQKIFDVDIAIATTGVAANSIEKQPTGTVFIGLYFLGNIIVKQFLFEGSRSEIQQSTLNAAIEMLICEMKNKKAISNELYHTRLIVKN